MDGKLSIQERATIHTVVLPLRKLLRKLLKTLPVMLQFHSWVGMVLRLF